MENNDSRNSGQRRVPLFTRPIAAQLARITLDFLSMLEEERLTRPQTTVQGEQGYSAEDITQITHIRRLHQDLGLDLGAVGIVLNMRRQILDLLVRMEEMEQRLAERERELLAEIHDLRTRLGVRVER